MSRTSTSPADTARSAQLDLTHRPRRLRRSPAVRSLVRETRLSPEMFVYPLFVCSGEGQRREVSSMPGVYQLSVDEAVKEAAAAKAEGINGVLLFGLPDEKDAIGSAAYQIGSARPIRGARAQARSAGSARRHRRLSVRIHLAWTLRHRRGRRDRERPVGRAIGARRRVACGCRRRHRRAVRHAGRPSRADPVDARPQRLPACRDHVGTRRRCSAFYGPFREAADSAPAFGDRRSHQMDPANVQEALREVALDLDEGADIVMVKPALTYLDVIWRVKAEFGVTTAAYHVSGEYHDAQGGRAQWLDRRTARDARDAHSHPPRRCRHHHHVLRARGCAGAAIGSSGGSGRGFRTGVQDEGSPRGFTTEVHYVGS